MAWRSLHTDLHNCWNHVADEDAFMAQQSERIDSHVVRLDIVDGKYDELGDRLDDTYNELHRTTEYCTGLHFSMVETGGYLMNSLGLTHDERVRMCTLERSNMMAEHTMGIGQYMGLVRQRVRAVGAADTTDNGGEDMESEPAEKTIH